MPSWCAASALVSRAMGDLSTGGGLRPESLDVLPECRVHGGGHVLADPVRIGPVGIEDLCVDPERNAHLPRMGADQAPGALAKIVFVLHLVIAVLRHSVSFRHGWLLSPKSAGYRRCPHRRRPPRGSALPGWLPAPESAAPPDGGPRSGSPRD